MRVLIVLLDDFSGVSRLPGALSRQGFQIAALCQESTYLAKTRFLARQYRWPFMRHRAQVLSTLAAAIADYDPSMVIPGDQRSASLLRKIADGEVVDPSLTSRIIDVLRRSLGDVQGYDEQIYKSRTHAAAAALGLPVPSGRPVASIDDAVQLAASIGFPLVLKRDQGAAGDGVRICKDRAQLEGSFRELCGAAPRDPPPMRLVRWLRGRYLRDCHNDGTGGLRAERFLAGRVATRAVVAWNGETLAAFSLLREIVHPEPLGPSCLVRFIAHAGMDAATAQLITSWKGSGFFGFDFIISEDDQCAYLLECNPRPIPISHIGGLGGHDLCSALAAKLIGKTAPADGGRRAELVALFPQEWRRDPTSHWLHDAYHDVPWDDPQLLRALSRAAR